MCKCILCSQGQSTEAAAAPLTCCSCYTSPVDMVGGEILKLLFCPNLKADNHIYSAYYRSRPITIPI